MQELIELGVRAAKSAGAAVIGAVDAITSGPLTPVGSNVPREDDEAPAGASVGEGGEGAGK
ncbi:MULTISPECIES: hypothetical protein [unclassified Streptomyces]|uniref:hypothetical protein n=1 Tax=unclassified Streptomyces TaxID=2593676 RepID=UPI0007480185|nr:MULTISPECIES: hypothetical protein [unclassified Streptomyces]KUL61540.1 hypothetical protein ADL30_07305 [Streptomyces sp. NRRL S-1521]